MSDADNGLLRSHDSGSAPEECAGAVLEAMAASPDDFAMHERLLYDLNRRIVDYAEQRAGLDGMGDFFWQLGETMPAFVTDALYQKRTTLFSLACLVALGWICGGLVSALFGLLGMGGEILRPLCIFAALWLSELISTHPRARRVLLVALGLGGIVRFTGSLVSGMLRIRSPAALFSAVFGRGPRPNIFSCAYMLLGAGLMYLIVSKKVVSVDLGAFRESLLSQVRERERLLGTICAELEDLADRERQESALSGAHPDRCPREKCRLASDVLRHLDIMPPELGRLLAESLGRVGFAPDSPNEEFIIWKRDEHEKLYDTIGLVRDGDKCVILERAYTRDGRVTKGKVQKDPL